MYLTNNRISEYVTISNDYLNGTYLIHNMSKRPGLLQN